jgi:hypothetical protein
MGRYAGVFPIGFVEFRMRPALLGLLGAAFLSAGAALAAPCATPIDRGAFDVAALKSELMLVALTCNMRDNYNQFIMQFRPDLVREERALNGWFSRAYGSHWRQQHDDYITNLANIESQAGLQRGTLFCQERSSMFPSVLALRTPAQLVSFAAHQHLPQPFVLESCAHRLSQPPHKALRTAERR